MPILILFAFLAGMVTILAPCIWPLLPIILSASSAGGKYRPLGITLGIMASFAVFTLSISYIEKIFHIDANTFRTFAVVAIILLGLSMLIPALGIKFEAVVNRLFNPLQGQIKARGDGFVAGCVMGFATGLLWAPCSGPILATVATLAATQAVNIKVVAVTLAYVCGLGLPLFLFSLAGSRLIGAAGWFSKYTARVQQGFGLVMIIAALLIYTNYDKAIQIKLLNIFPSYGNFLAKFENNKAVSDQLAALRGGNKAPDSPKAPEFTGITNWLNTSGPLSLAQLKGKVVLIDFWTYTCINCVRTLPHVVALYNKYKNYNFVVVGVHTPEFAFEKDSKNVQNAIKQFNIDYPVALDNDYQTWNAFDNRYWPAEYLIDANGKIRKTHFGEGEYDEMESTVRGLLAQSGHPVPSAASTLNDKATDYPITSETYLGLNRLERFVSHEKAEPGKHTFTGFTSIPQDHFTYRGTWDISESSIAAASGAALEINFKANKVFLVISPGNKNGAIKLFIYGKAVDEAHAGADVKKSRVILDTERLYNLIDLKGKVEAHLLRLEFEGDGVSLYAFTFG